MQLVDGFRDEPHITSQQVADSYIGLVGPGDYVMPVGNKFGADYTADQLKVQNYLVRIPDGVALIQGRRATIEGGEVVDLVIEAEQTGSTRNDLIVIRYTKNPGTLVENAQMIVVKGTPNNGDPVINGNTVIRDGAVIHDMPLYRVKTNAGGAVSIDRLFAPLTQPSQPGGVTESLIHDNAVSTSKIKDGAVTTEKIAAKAVTTAKIDDDAVRTENIDMYAVTTAKIAAKAVTMGKIGDEAVGTENISMYAVTTARLATKAVTQDKIGDEAVTDHNLAGAAVRDYHVASDAEIAATKLVASLASPDVPLLFPQLPSITAKTNIQTLLQSVRDCLAWIRSEMYPHRIKKDTVGLQLSPTISSDAPITISAHNHVSLYHGIPSINHIYAASLYMAGNARAVFIGGYNQTTVHIYNVTDNAITLPAVPTLNIIYD
jgi:hypothetical protein